jgi:hypothetical protein
MAPSVSLFSKLATKLTKPVIVLSKVPFVLASFKASAAPRPENSHSDEKDALFDLDTSILNHYRLKGKRKYRVSNGHVKFWMQSLILFLIHFIMAW